MDLERIRHEATNLHKGQVYGNVPYTFHLSYVEWVLARHNITDETLLKIAWLHDVLEDTPCTVHQLRSMVGPDIASVVELLTDEPGRNRKERKKRSLPKLRNDVRAAVVKIADRIANLECSLMMNQRNLIKMYRKEQEEFVTFVDPANFEQKIEGHEDLLFTLNNIFAR